MSDSSEKDALTVENEALVQAVREAIRRESLDRFAEPYLAEDARDWLAGFAARAAIRVIAERCPIPPGEEAT